MIYALFIQSSTCDIYFFAYETDSSAKKNGIIVVTQLRLEDVRHDVYVHRTYSMQNGEGNSSI